MDGTSGDFDVLIAATGYEIDLDIVSPKVLQVADNKLDLYMRMAPPGWPNLFFMGFFNTDTALNMVFEHQARWVREILLGNARLPAAPEMHAAIAERAAWYAGQYRNSLRHSIEEEHVRYLTDLRKTLKGMVRRRALNPLSRTTKSDSQWIESAGSARRGDRNPQTQGNGD